jgi:hypothetical protein
MDERHDILPQAAYLPIRPSDASRSIMRSIIDASDIDHAAGRLDPRGSCCLSLYQEQRTGHDCEQG